MTPEDRTKALIKVFHDHEQTIGFWAKVQDAIADAEKKAYEHGYDNGASSSSADWDIALSDMIEDLGVPNVEFDGPWDAVVEIKKLFSAASLEAVEEYKASDDLKKLLVRASEGGFDSAYTDWKLALGEVVPGDFLDYCNAKDAVAKVKALLIAARLEALEEAAKIAETVRSGPVYWVDGKPNAGQIIGGQHIAAAIRERISMVQANTSADDSPEKSGGQT